MTSLLIEARTVGHRGEVERRELEWADRPGTTTAAQLVGHVVRSEVAAYNRREHDRRFLRVLTEGEMLEQAAAGVVRAEVREHAQPADADDAVRVALEAFEDGHFLLFVDEAEVESADDTVRIHEGLQVRFVRMVPLAGGCT